MVSVNIVYGLSGHCPWTKWTLSMDSVESVYIVYVPILQPDNAHGQCPLSPKRFVFKIAICLHQNFVHVGCLSLPRGYQPVINHENIVYEIILQRDFFKLATNGHSKAFLLTPKFWPQEPCPGAIYIYKIMKKIFMK